MIARLAACLCLLLPLSAAAQPETTVTPGAGPSPAVLPAAPPGRAPGPQPPDAAPAYSPAGEPMTFRIAEGVGPKGAARWVSATGQIQLNTAAQFQAFIKANAAQGLPLVLDSTGGRVRNAMAMGRMARAANMSTFVGRTVTAGEREAVRTRGVSCSSACVLVLMGGVTRHVAQDARINVHMFSVALDAEGNKASADPTFRDIEQAQRTMAAHAVYVAEMGIAARYLEIMTEASFRGTMRQMTRDEITSTQLAFVEAPDSAAPMSANWLISPAGAPPQLIRTARLSDAETLTLDHELLLECDVVRSFFVVSYRQHLTRFEGPKGRQPVTFRTARLETGGWDMLLRAPERGLGISAAGGELWLRRSVPRKVFEDAARNGRLEVQLTPGRPSRGGSLYDGSLNRLLPDLARRCDARPGLVSMGGNPRR